MAAVVQLQGVKCPFKAVAEYPPALPYIGQDDCFHRLRDFTSSIQQEEQAHFLAIFGDWAIGKSRLAHELIAQFCGQSPGWTLSDGRQETLLLHPLAQGGAILPLFVSFVDALSFERFGFDVGTAMGKLTCAAATYLADLRRARSSHRDLLEALRAAITSAYPSFDFDRLTYLATQESLSFVERATQITKAIQASTNGQITRVLVMVDEVESGGEINPFADEIERVVNERPIPLRSVRDLYSGVKDAANTNAYPKLNFLFLNTLVSRTMANMEALERRMLSADLDKGSATDLEQLMNALREKRYPLYGLLEDVARRAFFAADRNFGWFSFIMNKAHFILSEEPNLDVSDVFAKVCERTGRVFQPRVFEDREIQPPALKDAMRRIIYNQEPTTLQELGYSTALLPDLLTYEDPFQTHFIGEAAIVEVSADQLTRDLLATGRYASDHKPRLTGEGSANFDPAELLASLRTFAWTREGTGTDGRNRLWLYLDPGDFERQVGFAYSGFGVNLSPTTVKTIHSALLERYRVPQSAALVAPTMALLRRFNDLWGKAIASNWLPERTWEQIITTIEQTPDQNERRLLQGVANALFEQRPQVVEPSPYKEVKAQALVLKLEAYGPFNVTPRNQLMILKARETAEGIIEDIRTIRPAIPVLLLFERGSSHDEWKRYLRESHQEHLAETIIPRIVEPQTREWEFYIRYSFCDQPGGFKATEVMPKGKELRREFKEALEAEFQTWLKQADESGSVLRPFFPAKSASAQNFRDFARVYAALLRAGSAAALVKQPGYTLESVEKALADYEREQAHDTLRLIEGTHLERRALAPSLFPRLLHLLQIQPRKLPELDSEFFYARSNRTVSFPTTSSGVLEQVMTLLQEMNLIEIDQQNRYVCRSASRLDAYFELALQSLGNFDGPKSGYAQQVSTFSVPLQTLAQQLAVNEDQLRLLKDQELLPARRQLRLLPMERLTASPPDQLAFEVVAQSIRQITITLSKLLGDPAQPAQPPVIDAKTLPDLISEIAQDKGYERFSVEYRIAFLKRLEEGLASREQQLRETLAAHKKSVEQAAPFPTGVMLNLLVAIEADVNGTLPAGQLPVQLQRKSGDTVLKVLKGAGRLSDVLQKLEWYQQQLDSKNREGWWIRYTDALEAWKVAHEAYRGVMESWRKAERYFQGTPDEHALKFTGPDLKGEIRDLSELAQNFGAELDQQANLTLADLANEVSGVQNRCAKLEQQIQAAQSSAQAEISKALEEVNDAAVYRLVERLNQQHSLPSRQKVLEARTHSEAHAALEQYREGISKLGASLCESQELFQSYLALYQDKQRGMDGDELVRKYGEAALLEMNRRKLITLRRVVDL